MKTLTLTIKRKWFDMILSGEKKEEYREVKKYYDDRFDIPGYVWIEHSLIPARDVIVRFRNGYKKDSPEIFVRLKRYAKGFGKPEWGAVPGEKYYVLELGNVIAVKNCPWLREEKNPRTGKYVLIDTENAKITRTGDKSLLK